jgi:Uma2 family endonuclease
MSLIQPQTYRWTLDRYLDLAESGTLAGERVELIDGTIIEMAPQKDAHALAVSNVTEELLLVFPRPFWVKGQSTLRLSDRSAPEPDVAVLPQRRDTGRALHDVPLLVVEVSDTTLAYDRGHKASLYASRGIADYWVINLVDGQVEVYRDPRPDAQASFGSSYSPAVVRKHGETVDVLAAPGKSIAVARLLP